MVDLLDYVSGHTMQLFEAEDGICRSIVFNTSVSLPVGANARDAQLTHDRLLKQLYGNNHSSVEVLVPMLVHVVSDTAKDH